MKSDIESGRRILVTGASGTLGYNIVRLLSARPDTELILPLRTLQPSLFRDLEHLELCQIEVSDPAQMRHLVSEVKPDVIVHCAASGVRPSRPCWFEMINFNVEATLRLFEASCELPECHFIYVSTGLVYREQGRPLNEADPIESVHPYGASKAAADCLLQAGAAEFKRRLTILRPFSFSGLHDGGGRLFPALLRAADAGEPFKLSPGEQVRDFCSVQDIAGAVEFAMSHDRTAATEIFNLGSGVSATLRQTVQRVCDELGLNVDLRFGEMPYHPYEPMHLVADIAKARSLGWGPKTNLAFAVWELAQSRFPHLALRCPERIL